MEAICLIPNCGRHAPAQEAFCSHHRDRLPLPKKQTVPCGECHIQIGEVCDICGAFLAEVVPKVPA